MQPNRARRVMIRLPRSTHPPDRVRQGWGGSSGAVLASLSSPVIISGVLRRLHTTKLFVGDVPLDADETHHARDVLRLRDGTEVEIFDDAGQIAEGIIHEAPGGGLIVRVRKLDQAPQRLNALTIAAAVPKGDRADWLVEKLSELDVDQYIPLLTDRSVVAPAGGNKFDRWHRLAIESAKQCRRSRVLRIEKPTPLAQAMSMTGGQGIYFTTEFDARHIATLADAQPRAGASPFHTTLFIGPEGGWSSDELSAFRASGLTPASLGPTILRVETAAIAAAVVVQALLYKHQ